MLEMMITAALTAAAGLALGYGLRVWMSAVRSSQMERDANQILKDAKNGADSLLKDAALKAKDEVLKAREEFEASTRSRRDELTNLDNRIAQKESNLERKVALIDKKERAAELRSAEVEKQAGENEKVREDLSRLMDEEKMRLQRIAGMTQAEARLTLMTRVESEAVSYTHLTLPTKRIV